VLEKAVDLESRDDNGQTPLSWAVQYGRKAVVELLVSKGVNLESRDNEGQTPLSWAARDGRKAIVELLVEKGANIDSKDNSGWTPVLWAKTNKWHSEEIIKLLGHDKSLYYIL
jgi:ankyrin repeat protein